MGRGGVLMRRLENVRGEFSLTALAYNIRRATTLAGIPELIAAVRPGAPRGGAQTSWNRPPKGLLQRIRAHGISESTQPNHGPNRPLTPQDSTRAYFSRSLVRFCNSQAPERHAYACSLQGLTRGARAFKTYQFTHSTSGSARLSARSNTDHERHLSKSSSHFIGGEL